MDKLDYAQLLEIYAKKIKQDGYELTDKQKMLIAEIGRTLIKRRAINVDKSRRHKRIRKNNKRNCENIER